MALRIRIVNLPTQHDLRHKYKTNGYPLMPYVFVAVELAICIYDWLKTYFHFFQFDRCAKHPSSFAKKRYGVKRMTRNISQTSGNGKTVYFETQHQAQSGSAKFKVAYYL